MTEINPEDALIIGTLLLRYGGQCFFFFQAEDGIRYLTVTGVQTCALPICRLRRRSDRRWRRDSSCCVRLAGRDRERRSPLVPSVCVPPRRLSPRALVAAPGPLPRGRVCARCGCRARPRAA